MTMGSESITHEASVLSPDLTVVHSWHCFELILATASQC